MTSLDQVARFLVEHALVQRLAVASVELALLCVVLAVALRATRARAPRLAALLWCVVLAKPLVTLCFGAPLELAVLEAPAAAVVVEGTPTVGEQLARGVQPSFEHDLAATGEVASLADTGASQPPRSERPLDLVSLLVVVWLAGAAVLLLRNLHVRLRLARIVARAEPAPPALARVVRDLARGLGVETPPSLRVTRELESPALVGLSRPVVLLPEWLAEQGACRATRWALRHELAHARWRDPLSILLRDLALALFYFHPLAWWAARRHLLALEQACDRDALRDPADGPVYAEELFRIAVEVRRRTRGPELAALGAAGRGPLTERVAALLEAERVRPLTRSTAVAAAVLATAVFAVGGAVVHAHDPHDHDGKKGHHEHGAAPSCFLLGPLSGDAFSALCEELLPRGGSVWGREHSLEVYRQMFDDPADPFHRRPGDVLVLLFAGDDGQRMPEAYADLLPAPWSDIEARLERGEDVEVSGSARDLRVLLLATPTRARLAELALPKIVAFASAPPRTTEASDMDVFIFGPADMPLFRRLTEIVSGPWSKTGRPHDAAFYRETFEDPANPHDRSDGDLLVLLVTLEADGRPPAGYDDLLLEPWAEIEKTLRSGETVELAGEARGLEVVVLGTADRAGLSALVERTTLLDSYRLGKTTEAVRPSIGLPRGTRYVVTFDEDDRRLVAVRVEIPASKGALALRMGHGASHLDGGYTHFLRGISATAAGGRPVAVRRDDEGRVLLSTNGQPVVLEYTLELGHDASPWPEGGPDEGPYANGSDAFWTGRALFLSGENEGVDVEFHLPEGWRVSTPWEPVGERENAFHVADENDLFESFLLAGTHEQLVASCGDTQVLLAVGADMGTSAARLRDVVQQMLESGRALFGGVPAGRELLVANVGPHGGLNGGVFGRSISLLANRPFDADEAESWAPFVAHEVVHLWNGGGMKASGREAWFSEGFTEYYAHVLCARLGLIDRQRVLDRVERAARAYLEVADVSSIRESELRAMQYDGGFLVALLLDLRLRQSGEDLDDLMRALFRRHAEGAPGYDLRTIGALGGSDVERFLSRFVDGREPLPLAEDLAAAGLRLDVDVEGASLERGYVVHDVLGIRSLTQTAEGMLIRRTADTSFEEDDLLTAIDGEPVARFADLQGLLTARDRGDTVQLTIVRHGETTTLPLVLGGSDSPPLEKHVTVKVSGIDSPVLDAILAPSGSDAR